MWIRRGQLISSNPLDQGNLLAAPFQSVTTVIASGTLSGSFTTPGINMEQSYGYSVTAIISGSLTGSIALQASDDLGFNRVSPILIQQTSGSAATFPDQGLRNWNTVASQQLSASTLGGSSIVTFNGAQQYEHWLRLSWTHSLGTGSIDANITAKGA